MNKLKELPMIAGIGITTDTEGRFNLNALHKAHLSLNPGLHHNSKQPADWLKLAGTKELIDVISNSEDLQFKPIESKSGRYGGTFAHELLAISYAGWISPAFQLQVNQVFLDYRTGKLTPANDELSRMDILKLAMQSEEERLRLEQEKQQLECRIEQDAPKVAFHDKVSAAPDAISVSEAAKILGTGQRRLFAYLRQIGWVTRRNEPYQAKIETGYLDVKLGNWEHPDHGLKQSVTTLITGKGMTKLQRLMAAPQPELAL